MTIIAQKRRQGMEINWNKEMKPKRNMDPQEEIKSRGKLI